MNRIDDITIERYLGGGMSPAEQAQFRAMLAGDAALRRRVASEEAMLRALRADRAASARDHTAARARALEAVQRLAPAGAPATPSGDRSASAGRWPIIGTLLLVGAWIAIDSVSFERDAARIVERVPVARDASDAVLSRESAASNRPQSATPQMPSMAAPSSQLAPPAVVAPAAERSADGRAAAARTSNAASSNGSGSPAAAVDRASASDASGADEADASADAVESKQPLRRVTEPVARTPVTVNK